MADETDILTEGGELNTKGERCLVVYPYLKSRVQKRDPEARLEEAVGLAHAIALDVVEADVVSISRGRPATLMGGGAVERLAGIVADKDIVIVVVDAQLSPVQQRNLEKALSCKVIDRTGLILEIFGERARTREGRLQVDLALLSYQRSRLVRSWTHLERQRGGAGFMGGPGESQLEIDRRLLDQRMTKLRRELEEVKRTRHLHRKARKRVPYPVVALVGYTNAGKSTLFNRLTDADVFAQDLLFATLDPTMRSIELPSGRKVILSDTVGFISDLPHELVNAFHATLEEVSQADVVVHVRDVSHPDTDEQKADVLGVLREMDFSDSDLDAVIEVENKVDLLDADGREVVFNIAARAQQTMVPVSALSGEGCDTLLAVLDRRLSIGDEVIEVTLAPSAGRDMAWLYDHGDVLARQDNEDGICMTVRLAQADAARFQQKKAAKEKG